MVKIDIRVKCSCGYEKEIKADLGIFGELQMSSGHNETCPQCGKKI